MTGHDRRLGHHGIVGSAGQSAWSAIARLGCGMPKPPRGRGVFRTPPRVPCQTEPALKETRWSRTLIVINAPFTGLTTTEREQLKALERENREVRRANEILKTASASFAAELDRRPTR